MASRSELLRLLTEYSPVDPDERQYRLDMLDLAAVAHDPFDRHDYTPGHFTASGFVVHPEGESVLLIHHAKIERWLQPGGHIDPADVSPIAAAIREIEEETGVVGLSAISDAIIDIDIHVFPERPDQPEHRHFDVRFAFVAADPDLTANHEVHEARWVSRGEIGALNQDRSVLRPIDKLLGDLSSTQ
jgi:8-oxo-dGTP pyrophosphatase MutT (NUDIX family)